MTHITLNRTITPQLEIGLIKGLVWLYVLALSVMLSACHQSGVKDENLTTKPTRILSLAPSHTEWIFALGAEGTLVGRTDRCDQPKQVSDVPSVGSLFPPKIERMIAARPTDALMIEGHVELKDQLRRVGVTVHTFTPRTVDGIFEMVSRLGILLEKREEADRWTSRSRAQLAKIRVPRRLPRVLIEVWFSPLTIAGRSSYMGDLVHRAGGQQISGVGGYWPSVNLEAVVRFDPEVLFISTKAHFDQLISATPPMPWREMTAVKSGRVYLLEGRLARPGPKVIEELEWLNQKLLQL